MGEQNEGLAGTGITVRELIEVFPEILQEALTHYDDDQKLDTKEIVQLLQFTVKTLATKADPDTASDLRSMAGMLGLVRRFL